MAYTKQTFTAGQTLKASDLNTMSQGIVDKQDKLVSGTNIKTINGQSLLGSGDVEIDGFSTVQYTQISGLVYAEGDEEHEAPESPENPEQPEQPTGVRNLFDKNTMVVDGELFALAGSQKDTNSRSGYIPIEGGATYAFWAEGKPWQYTSMGAVYILDSEKAILCKFNLKDGGGSHADANLTGVTMSADKSGKGWTFTAPENSAFLAFTLCWKGGTDYTDVLMVEVGDTCHDYVAYSENASATYTMRATEPVESSSSQSDLTGYEIVKLFNANLRDSVARAQIQALAPTSNVKKWTVLGDSISASHTHSEKLYHDILGEKYGLEVTNLAVSGSGWQSMLANAMPNIPDDTELITIMIGTNDVARGWTAGENGVCGPIESALLYVLQNRPNAKLAVITPVPRGDSAENRIGSRNIAKLIVSTCEYYSVPHFDLSVQSGMYPDVAERVSIMYNDSGVHPNLNGHTRMASAIEPFFKTLIS